MDPVHAAWLASHPQDSLPPGKDCARCGAAPGSINVREVVSRKFTAWDSWVDLRSPLLCTACAWGYRTPRVRSETLLVTCQLAATPTCRTLDPSQLFEILAQGPLSTREALSLPLRAGRRHVLPLARFGQICLDGTNLTWSHGDTRRMHLIATLRERDKVPWSALTDPAPPWHSVSNSDDPVDLMRTWDELRPWRESGLWLQVAIAATHPSPHQTSARP